MAEPSTRRGRLIGIDAARGLAVVTMFVAHVAPIERDSPLVVRVLVVADAMTAPLFALLVGVSMALMTGGTQPVIRGQGRGRLALQLVIRAAIITLLGYALELLGAQVAIVLQFLGLAMLALIPLLYLRPAAQLVIAAVVVASAPVLVSGTVALIRVEGIELLHRSTPVIGELVYLLFAAPYYQAFVFAAYGLVGIAAVRLGLSSPRVTLILVAVGLVLVMTSYGLARPLGITAEAYAPTVLSYAAGAGWACIVLGAFAWVTLSSPEALRKVSRAILSPIADVGTMTLTVYSLQIVTLGLWARANPGLRDDSWLMLLLLVGGSVIFAVLWTRFIGRGPLEWIIAVASGRTRQRGARLPNIPST